MYATDNKLTSKGYHLSEQTCQSARHQAEAHLCQEFEITTLRHPALSNVKKVAKASSALKRLTTIDRSL